MTTTDFLKSYLQTKQEIIGISKNILKENVLYVNTRHLTISFVKPSHRKVLEEMTYISFSNTSL